MAEDARSIWTVRHPVAGWGNRREGSSRFLSRSHRKDIAERLGRQFAKTEGIEHVTCRRDGSIEERLTYDRDGRVLR
jgi:hypothetical protein